ncbi:hypothetical protein BSL78_12937 [Apostichopus japonicus]|uniref:Uncharacterized protein n=1 Tax=Stichopus japonicus TaxID=307972 RepID=A0A2G8KQ97_STIJA|nr:hypothetical protein BSL78_12937 [Apostichopus japonicus]
MDGFSREGFRSAQINSLVRQSRLHVETCPALAAPRIAGWSHYLARRIKPAAEYLGPYNEFMRRLFGCLCEAAQLVVKNILLSPESQEILHPGKNSRETGINLKKRIKIVGKFHNFDRRGYKRLDVQRALKLSNGKLDLGRRILLLAKEEHADQTGLDVYSGVLQTEADHCQLLAD